MPLCRIPGRMNHPEHRDAVLGDHEEDGVRKAAEQCPSVVALDPFVAQWLPTDFFEAGYDTITELAAEAWTLSFVPGKGCGNVCRHLSRKAKPSGHDSTPAADLAFLPTKSPFLASVQALLADHSGVQFANRGPEPRMDCWPDHPRGLPPVEVSLLARAKR